MSVLHLPRDVPEVVRCFQVWGQCGQEGEHLRKQRQSLLKPKCSQTWPPGPCLSAEHLFSTKLLGVWVGRSTAESRLKLLVKSPSCNFLIILSGICLHARKMSPPKASSTNSLFYPCRILVRPKQGFHLFTGGRRSLQNCFGKSVV